jgi:hypothetical protein
MNPFTVIKNYFNAGNLGEEIGRQLAANGLPDNHWESDKLVEIAGENGVDLNWYGAWPALQNGIDAGYTEQAERKGRQS